MLVSGAGPQARAAPGPDEQVSAWPARFWWLREQAQQQVRHGCPLLVAQEPHWMSYKFQKTQPH